MHLINIYNIYKSQRLNSKKQNNIINKLVNKINIECLKAEMWTSKATREIQIETILRFDTMSVTMTTIKKINGEGLGR